MIYETDKSIKQTALTDSDVINLITMPGLDFFSALLIKSELIDINRFASFGRLCAYAGLAPRVAQSANKTTHGPLNVNRRKNLQWILFEVVYHYFRSIPEKKELFEKLAKKKSPNTAKVIMARDMLRIIYHILKEKRPFLTNKNDLITHAA